MLWRTRLQRVARGTALSPPPPRAHSHAKGIRSAPSHAAARPDALKRPRPRPALGARGCGGERRRRARPPMRVAPCRCGGQQISASSSASVLEGWCWRGCGARGRERGKALGGSTRTQKWWRRRQPQVSPPPPPASPLSVDPCTPPTGPPVPWAAQPRVSEDKVIAPPRPAQPPRPSAHGLGGGRHGAGRRGWCCPRGAAQRAAGGGGGGGGGGVGGVRARRGLPNRTARRSFEPASPSCRWSPERCASSQVRCPPACGDKLAPRLLRLLTRTCHAGSPGAWRRAGPSGCRALGASVSASAAWTRCVAVDRPRFQGAMLGCKPPSVVC